VSNAYTSGFMTLLDVDPVAGQWEAPVDLRPIAPVGCCSRCGGATWQHEAHDICGQCGNITHHEVLELRLLRRST